LHYGLDWKIGKTGYEFDKHWFYDFDALKCPPWNISTDRSTGGLFKHPPHPSLYPTKVLKPSIVAKRIDWSRLRFGSLR